jgi:hypothetical protein
MVGWKAKAVGVGIEIGQAEGLGVSYEQAQHAPPGRACPYPGFFVGLQSNGDEFGQRRTILIENAEGTEAGPGHGTGLLDHVTQEYRQLEIPLNEQGRLENPPELGWILNGAIGHKTALYQGKPANVRDIPVIERPNTTGAAEMG